MLEKINEDIYAFFKDYLGIKFYVEKDEYLFAKAQYFKTRDIVWLFSFLCNKYELPIDRVPKFQGEVTINNIANCIYMGLINESNSNNR